MTDPIEVEIFGRTYQIKGGQNPEYTRQLAAFVDEQVRTIADRSPPSASPHQISILTLLHVAHELFEARRALEHSESAVEEKAEALIDLLEASLSPTD